MSGSRAPYMWLTACAALTPNSPTPRRRSSLQPAPKRRLRACVLEAAVCAVCDRAIWVHGSAAASPRTPATAGVRGRGRRARGSVRGGEAEGGLVVRFDRGAALDVDLRQPLQPGGQPPVPAAEKLHAGRHEDGTDDRRVQEDGRGEAEAGFLQ